MTQPGPQLATSMLAQPLSRLVQSAPPAPLIDDDRLPSLAYALASGTKPPDQVLMEYGLDPADASVGMLLDSERFTRLYLQACDDLKQEGDGQERVRNRARRAVENTLPEMERAVSSPAPLSERVQAFRAIAKVAGLEDPPPPQGSGERFVINISVPGAGAQVAVVHADMAAKDVLFPPGRENAPAREQTLIDGTATEGNLPPVVELAGAEAEAYLDRDIFGNPLPR